MLRAMVARLPLSHSCGRARFKMSPMPSRFAALPDEHDELADLSAPQDTAEVARDVLQHAWQCYSLAGKLTRALGFGAPAAGAAARAGARGGRS